HHFEEILLGITPYTNAIFHFCGKINQLDSSNCVTSILGRADTSLAIAWAYMDGPTAPNNHEEYCHVVNISYGSICAIGSKLAGLGGLGMFFAGFNYQGSFINGFAPTDGGSQDDRGFYGVYTSRGRVIGIGSTLSVNDYCPNNNLGQEDVFLVRYNSDSIQTNGVVPRYNCFADTLPLWVANIKSYYSDVVISLFPNPVYDHATLKISGNTQGKYTAKAFSVLGEEILRLPIKDNKDNLLDLSSLPPGSYFLKVENESGNTVSTIKFIVTD
ncbi:MAG TPA: T9SS type A sorting domain-containing protein, partial [Bacteroidia bacterium]|nr:T9SS type A sorting domain-containing protein [Bacteroidia bacterium]